MYGTSSRAPRRTEKVIEQGFSLKECVIHGTVAVDEDRATKEAAFLEGSVAV